MNFAALLRIVSASLVLACNLQGPALARDVTLATDEARARLERLIAIANDPSDPYVMVEAHRGAWDDARPENSIPAIEHAIGIGVDVIEFDIRETKDGHLVVMHDETVDRTTTITGKVVDLSLAEIVAARLETKDGRITDLHPPTLSEVLDVMKDRILFRPDIKCRPGCDDAVFNALIEKGMLWQAVTNPNFVARYREYGIAGKRLMVSGGQMLKYASDPAAMPAEVDWLDFKDFDGKDPPLAELRALKGRVRIVGFTYTDKRVGQRGDALSARDPDAGWGWLIDHGANILLTDTAEPLIGYLERRGLRTLR